MEEGALGGTKEVHVHGRDSRQHGLNVRLANVAAVGLTLHQKQKNTEEATM